jgi:deoxycytidylate deaminase
LAASNGAEMDIYPMAAKLAHGAAALSTCQRTKVGAVLFDSITGDIFGVGYNAGLECDSTCPRGRFTFAQLPTAVYRGAETHCITKHAEIMALENAHIGAQPVRDVAIVVNHKICAACRLVLYQLHIAMIECP